VKRPKQPYRAPDIPAFFNGTGPRWEEDLLRPETIADSGYFDPARVGLLVKKIKNGRAIGYKDNMALVGILSTQVWHQHFAGATGRPTT
jgi:asparagine synthase (glutamine-hydrolysing)